jgi:hypothetical protein
VSGTLKVAELKTVVLEELGLKGTVPQGKLTLSIDGNRLDASKTLQEQNIISNQKITATIRT